jgi:hypothetical protein
MTIGKPNAPISATPGTTLDIKLIAPTNFEKYKPHGLKVEESTLEGVIIEVTSSSTIESEQNDKELETLRIMLKSIGASRSIASMGIKLHFQDGPLLEKYLGIFGETIMASSSIIFLDLEFIDGDRIHFFAHDDFTGNILSKNRKLFLSRLKTFKSNPEKLNPIDLATLYSQINLLCRLKVESWYQLDSEHSSTFARELLDAANIDVGTNIYTNMDNWLEQVSELTFNIRKVMAFAFTKMPLPPKNEQANGTTLSFMLALLACNGGNYPPDYEGIYHAALSAMKQALTPDTASIPPEMAEID